MARSGSRRGPREGAVRGSCRRRLRPPRSAGTAPARALPPRQRAAAFCSVLGHSTGARFFLMFRDPAALGPPRAPALRPLRSVFGHGPAPAPLWTPRLLGVNRPRAGTPSVLSSVTPLLPSLLQQPARTLTYCSLRKGKRKSVKSVVKRFLRLHNGLWVRRKSGYKKKLWKKSAAQKKRLREFVLCTRTQCKLLDKMTTSFWKRRNWYIDDPYQKYHDRTNLRV
ncbi:39S ribosomal protein L35, mitochondrial [Corvus cornix cornix]|uniref:39S ribosomal protein L35, mitochondrial n=1 Tax=Corvus cornix cornix TaxID=932674 RepID=UPI00194DBCDF|nr:39S ribosomal protein L35, mitochondrial [Corvus cornix cornix]